MSGSLSATESAQQLLHRLSNPQLQGTEIKEVEIQEMRKLLHHVINLETVCANTNVSSAPIASAPTPFKLSGSSVEPKVAPPQFFNGDRKYLNEFVVQVKMVFSLQPSRFTSEKSKVIYCCSYLRNSAFTWVQPILETIGSPSEHPCLNDFQEFIDRLRAAFGDPNPFATAERELYKLTQGSQSASEYAANFQRFATRVRWNEDALKYHFIHGLNDDLQDELATRDLPADFSKYVQKVIALDNQIRERRSVRSESRKPSQDHSFVASHLSRFKSHSQNQHHHSSSSSASRQPQAGGRFTPSSYSNMSSNIPRSNPLRHYSPTANNSPNQPSPSSSFGSSSSSGPTAMELGASRKQTFYSPIPDDEKKRRLDLKLCLYCGQPGHVVKTCPAKSRSSSVSSSKNSKTQY